MTNHAPAGLFSDGLEAARRVPDRFPLLISLHDLEVAMLAVVACVILAIAIALYLRRRGVVDRTDPSYVEGYTPVSLVDVVV